MVKISKDIYDQMVSHAQDGVPNEACGLFASEKAQNKTHAAGADDGDAAKKAAAGADAAKKADGGADAADAAKNPTEPRTITKFFPMANAAESREIYLLDGAEMISVEKQAEESGLEILGVMHSHTYTQAYPSPTDVNDATNTDPFGVWLYIIVSLEHDEPYMKCFQIQNREITEVEIQVV